MKTPKKNFLFALPPEQYSRLKETSARLSMTMTALLNKVVLDYLDRDFETEKEAETQAARITALEKQVVEMNRTLKAVMKQQIV